MERSEYSLLSTYRPLSTDNFLAKRVQSLLGHASITQTMDTYSNLIDDIGGDAVDGLDDAFGL